MRWSSLIKIKWMALSLFLVMKGHCQFKDAGLWSEIAVSVEHKDWTFQCAPEVRMHENITRVGRAFVDFGVQYKWSKQVFITSTYRAGVADQIDYYDTRQRMQLGMGWKQKFGDLTCTWLSRAQVAMQGRFAETDADFQTTWRNRVQLKYNLTKKWAVGSSMELFHNIERYQSASLQNWRWMATLDRDLPNKQSIRVGYLIQKNLSNSPQEIDFVFLLGYNFQFDWKTEEKNDMRFIGTPSF